MMSVAEAGGRCRRPREMLSRASLPGYRSLGELLVSRLDLSVTSSVALRRARVRALAAVVRFTPYARFQSASAFISFVNKLGGAPYEVRTYRADAGSGFFGSLGERLRPRTRRNRGN